MENILIEIKELKKYFPSQKRKVIKAVNGVNLKIFKGETLGLVGESGCGKSTLGNLILGLDTPTSGEILLKGKNINKLKKKELKKVKNDLNVVFQDPLSSLNPRMAIADIIKEPLIEVSKKSKQQNILEEITQSLEKVGLLKETMFRYPHEFSGGQKQRIAIARAIINHPEFIILDEPTSGLDVSVQAQILNLLIKLKKEFNMSYLFISHNMAVVKYISSRVAVMYKGNIVELAKSEDIFHNPSHPYTQILLTAVPDIAKRKITEIDDKVLFSGSSETKNFENCSFYPRCQYHQEKCLHHAPGGHYVSEGHLVYCHRVN